MDPQCSRAEMQFHTATDISVVNEWQFHIATDI